MRRLWILLVLGLPLTASAQDRPTLDELAAHVAGAPADADARRQLAERYTEAGDPARAIPHLEWLAAQNPGNVAVRRDLADHLVWTDQPTRAAGVLEEIIALDSTDVVSRLRLAEIIMWSGGADRAVEILRPVAAENPRDARVQRAYAFALHASEDEQAARRQYDVALGVEPENATLLLESGALERWKGDWSEGMRRIARAKRIGLDPADARRADELLAGLDRQFAPTVTTTVTQITDSNALTRTSTPLQIGLTLNSRWSLGLGLRVDHLASSTPEAAVPQADAIGVAPTVAYSPSRLVRLAVGVGAERTPGERVALQGEASARRTWDEPRFASVQIRAVTASATDGVEAIDAGIRLSRATVEGYAELPLRLAASATFDAGRYSDGNGRVQAGTTLRQTALVVGEREDTDPLAAAGLMVGALYEDTGTVYPDARPYYTPDRLATVTGGVFGAASPGAGLAVNGDLGLIRQSGPIGASTSVFYRAAASLAVGRHQALVEIGRTGSSVYSADTVTLRYHVRL